ncbi:MAG: glucose-6-phosphate isomerase family protein [Candidatus Aenigmatarchaeota archaeon]
MKLNTEPLKLEYKNKKLFLNDIELRPSVRTLKEMKKVLLDENFVNEFNENEITYLMFRDLKREEDRKLFEEKRLRYDITIIFSKLLGKEFNKTFGHIHPIVESNLTYPEVYEILKGKALFILQEFESEKVKKVLLVFAKKGEKILIPPNFGHVTINIGKRDLILSNLVSNKFHSNYEIYEKKRGAAIYVVSDEQIYPYDNVLSSLLLPIKMPIRIFKNPNYSENFEIEVIKPKNLFDFPKENLYKSFIESPDFYNFLNKPSLIWQK